jgi:hydroxymethylglutaryl-CoA synthase
MVLQHNPARETGNGDGRGPAAAAPGLSGLALCLPPYRVDLRSWCKWTGNDWEKIRRVVGDGFRLLGPRQSVYTLAASAVLRLIRQYDVDPSRVRFLGMGTESSTDNSAGAVIVKGMVDEGLQALGLPPLSRHCEVPEFKHACLGGVYALKGALRHLETDAEPDGVAIVVCTDKAIYQRGSTGEPTQGAGAVALLLEPRARIATINLRHGGSASDYRGIDFRKPLTARLGANGEAGSLDIPVYNGRYSTNCYVDEIRVALADMHRRRGLRAAEHLRSLAAVFMHRPYQRMPETGLGLAWLFALAQGSPADRDELAAHCHGAGLNPADVLAEMASPPDVCRLAVQDRIQEEIYPLTMAVLKAFRQSDSFRRHVLDLMTLGSGAMREMGNLYTGALPAWLAAGLDEAAQRGTVLAGREILLVGYGSGDAAEALPATVVPGWEEAAARIQVAPALAGAVDVTRDQYYALREGKALPDLGVDRPGDFIVERVGRESGQSFQDLGVEYYRYIM